VGQYIVHDHRKIKVKKVNAAPSIDIEATFAREKELSAHRDEIRLEREQARIEKEERARARIASKRQFMDLDKSGRQRVAVRSAGLVVISATAGLHTNGVTIFRPPEAAPCSIWGAKIEFDIPEGFTHYFDDPTAPADVDALHAMRALAPRIAELLLLGQTEEDGADEKNLRSAQRLAESYMHKAYSTDALSGARRGYLSRKIVRNFELTVEGRLKHFWTELGELVSLLMTKPKISRKECDAVLSPLYKGFDDFYRSRQKPELYRPPRPSNLPNAGVGDSSQRICGV
jgi:hypothetical protein